MVVTWHDRAACRGVAGVDWDAELTPAAAELCLRCPVRVECLTEALDREPKCDVGVWGATGPKARYRIRVGQLTVDGAWAEARNLAAQPVLAP